MVATKITSRTAHYEVNTANSTYYVRVIPGKMNHLFQVASDEIDVWGRHGRFSLASLPVCGAPLTGNNPAGKLTTTNVVAIRKISEKVFAKGLESRRK
jgi:hypothetical protein